MSENAEALNVEIARLLRGWDTGGVESPDEVARAICEHLGLTWEVADEIDGVGADRQHSAIATLLEAAGVER